MKKAEINKSDWSGETGTVKLYADGKRFRICSSPDTIFRIVPTKHDMSDIDGLEDYHTYKVQYKYAGDGEWQDTDIKGHEHERQLVGERVLCDHHYEFTSYFGEYGRTSKEDPRLACAKHLYNVF